VIHLQEIDTMSQNVLFAQIQKVDEAKRLVYGRATQEVVDRSGEIFDYASSKPNFQKWSNEAVEATDGKSLGNVRAMHSNVAVGKVPDPLHRRSVRNQPGGSPLLPDGDLL
jgi:hypothetical protein